MIPSPRRARIIWIIVSARFCGANGSDKFIELCSSLQEQFSPKNECLGPQTFSLDAMSRTANLLSGRYVSDRKEPSLWTLCLGPQTFSLHYKGSRQNIRLSEKTFSSKTVCKRILLKLSLVVTQRTLISHSILEILLVHSSSLLHGTNLLEKIRGRQRLKYCPCRPRIYSSSRLDLD